MEVQTTITDLALRYNNPIIRALVQLVPVAGGSVDTLITAALSRIDEERTKTFFDELAKGARALDEETAKGEPFLHAYFATVKAARSTRQREKIQFLARLLAAGTRGMIEYGDDYEESLSILEETSYQELHTLERLAVLERNHPYVWFHTNERETDRQRAGRIWTEFISGFGSWNEDAIRAHLTRLARTGLYEPLTGGYGDEGGRGRTTLLYRRLASSIEPPDSEAPPPISIGDFELATVRFELNGEIVPDAVVNSKVQATVEYRGKNPQAAAGRVLRIRIEYIDTDRILNGVTYPVTFLPLPKRTVFSGQFSERINGQDTRCQVRISELVP